MHKRNSRKTNQNCTDCYQKKNDAHGITSYHRPKWLEITLYQKSTKQQKKSRVNCFWPASFISGAIDIDIYNFIRATCCSLRISHLIFHIFFVGILIRDSDRDGRRWSSVCALSHRRPSWLFNFFFFFVNVFSGAIMCPAIFYFFFFSPFNFQHSQAFQFQYEHSTNPQKKKMIISLFAQES